MPAKKMCSGDDDDDIGDGHYYNCEVNDGNVYYQQRRYVDSEHDGDVNDDDNDD